MSTKKRLVLVGDSVFAQVAYEFFSHDSPYEVVAFSVERPYLKQETMFDLPIVAFEELEQHYPPATHDIFVSIVFTQANRLRTRLYHEAKAKGYGVASYISSRAKIMSKTELGEHCFICEDNVIQSYAAIGNNVVLWSGNQVSSFCVIGDNCFILPNSVFFGFVTVGENCIVSSNVAVESNVRIGADCFIGPGVTITENVADRQTVETSSGGMGDVSRCEVRSVSHSNR